MAVKKSARRTRRTHSPEFMTPLVPPPVYPSAKSAEATTILTPGGGDGRGAWRDNVFVERLWRSVKYECVYLKAYDGVSAAHADIGHRLVQHTQAAFEPPPEPHAVAGLLRRIAKASGGRIKCPGAPRGAYRVGRSSQATPAAVDNSAPSQSARNPLVVREKLFKQPRPLLRAIARVTFSLAATHWRSTGFPSPSMPRPLPKRWEKPTTAPLH